MRASRVVQLAASIAILLSALSCGQQPLTPGGVQPSAPPPSLMPSQPPSSTSPATAVPRASGTFVFPLLPSLTPTAVPVSTSTGTPLPPLPGFEQTLTFGGGTGCDRCGMGYCLANQNLAIRPSVFGTSINEWNEPSERTGYLCLWGITPELPFTVRLTSPDGNTVLSSDFVYNAGKLSWDGNPRYVDSHESDDGLINAELPILWPIGVPTGIWQITSVGRGLQAQGSLDDTRLGGDEVNRVQEVGVVDGSLGSRIVPANHLFVPSAETGGLNVTGRGFTPASIVFVLIYQRTDRTGSDEGYVNLWDLRHAHAVVADDQGAISTEIPGPFYTGQTYMVVSVSDPRRLALSGAPWTFNFNDDSIGYETFQVGRLSVPDRSR